MNGGACREAGSSITAIEAARADSTGRRNTPRQEVTMTTCRRKSERSTPNKLPSPGRPPVWQRENLCRFWRGVAAGLSSKRPPKKPASRAPCASGGFGVPADASHTSCARGGVTHEPQSDVSGTPGNSIGVRSGYWSACDRTQARPRATISREVRRNSATRSGDSDYRALTAQWHADRAARRPTAGKLSTNLALRQCRTG